MVIGALSILRADAAQLHAVAASRLISAIPRSLVPRLCLGTHCNGGSAASLCSRCSRVAAAQTLLTLPKKLGLKPERMQTGRSLVTLVATSGSTIFSIMPTAWLVDSLFVFVVLNTLTSHERNDPPAKPVAFARVVTLF